MEVGRFIVPKVILKRRDDVKLCTIVAPGCAKCTKMQTIITCTGLEEFVRNRFEINQVFHVINGKVYENDIHPQDEEEHS